MTPSKTLAIYARHDANLSISNSNVIETYLEFEKIAKKRYFAFKKDARSFEAQLRDYALPHFDPLEISEVVYNWLNPEQLSVLMKNLPNCRKSIYVPHHPAHAQSSYVFTLPKEKDLIVSIDGGGDKDDYFKVFLNKRNKLEEVLDVKINLGKPYRLLGLISPELYSSDAENYNLDLPLSGKIMSLSGLGTIRKDYVPAITEFYLGFMQEPHEENRFTEENFKRLIKRLGLDGRRSLNPEMARDVLATSQYIFEETIKKNVYPIILEINPSRVIMVGGCGLNVTMNSKIERELDVEVFTPPCPNDCGISLGALKLYKPGLECLTSPFSKLQPTGSNAIIPARLEFHSNKISLEDLARIISGGAIVGTMVGPIEIGPRALGNRSYLANPLIPGMKDRINSSEIKNRESWRPVAPIIPIERLNEYFETRVPSPYMTFAPITRNKYIGEFGEIVHVDGSARIQTVTAQDGWIYHLVKAVGKITGRDILMNTSFNIKGQPLINDYSEAFDILRSSDLEGIVISKKGDLNDFEFFQK